MNNNELQKIIKRGNISNELKRIADIYEREEQEKLKIRKMGNICGAIMCVALIGGLIALILINVL